MRLMLNVCVSGCATQETDQLRADSSKVEGLLGQYGRQVEQLAGSVASTQQQYEALQSQVGVFMLM